MSDNQSENSAHWRQPSRSGDLTVKVTLDTEVARLIDCVAQLTRENRALRNRLVSEIAQHAQGDYELRVAEAEARVNEFEEAFRAASERRRDK